MPYASPEAVAKNKEERVLRANDHALYEQERYLNRLKASESKMNRAYDYLNNNVKLKEEEFFA